MELKNFTKEQLEEIKEHIAPEIIKKHQNEAMINFARQLQSTLANNEIISQKKNIFSMKFNRETVSKYLENPQRYEKELRSLSTILFTISPQYQSIMTYLPSICRFYAIASPNIDKFSNAKGVVDTEKLRKEYYKVISQLDMLNIKHEFLKIVSVCVRDDVFYGYEMETNDSYFIRQMDSDYCKITSIEDGVFNYSFDFAYFDKFKDLKGIEGNVIDSYPQEFTTKYNLYLKDKTNMRWQELDSSKTICIKMLEDIPFVFPAFASLYEDISNLSAYKGLNLSKNEIENYRFVGLKIPTLSKSDKADDFAVSVDTALNFYQMILNSLPSGVGAFITPTDFEFGDFGKNGVNSVDEINRAEDNIYSSSGIAPINFGKGVNSSGTAQISNTIDQARMFKLYAQLERWLNRKFKRAYNNRFTIELLRVTEFNINSERDNALKQAQYGLPVKIKLAALNDISQQMERGLSVLENEVLGIADTWIPLSSSHTQSSTEEAGRPLTDDTELSDSGEATRENDSNANR